MNKLWVIMTNHKIETGTAVTLVCMIIFLVFTTHSCIQDVKEAGGFRTVIVEAGKETKLIANDIDKAVNNHYESERNDPYP